MDVEGNKQNENAVAFDVRFSVYIAALYSCLCDARKTARPSYKMSNENQKRRNVWKLTRLCLRMGLES